MSQWFFVKLVAENNGCQFVITAQSGTAPGTVITTEQLPAPATVDAMAKALWQISPDGYISSALDPNAYLTLGMNTPVVGQETLVMEIGPRAKGAMQQWTILPGNSSEDNTQAIIATPNAQGQLLGLGTYAEEVNNNVWIATFDVVAGGSYGATQLWTIEPCLAPTDQWTTIKSALSTPGEDFLVGMAMAEQGTATKGGTLSVMPQNAKAIAGPSVGFGNGSTWQLTSAGCLVNGWNDDLVLTAGVSSDGSLDGTVWVFANQSGNGAPPLNQVWIVPERGVLVSGADQTLALTLPVSGETPVAGTQLSLTAYAAGQATAGQKWDCFPGVALQTLLVQPPVPFPKESATYALIEATLWPTLSLDGGQLGVPDGGLRGQYTNLAAPLASYQSQVLTMTPPTPPPHDWDAVVAQLSRELTAAQSVQALFQQLSILGLEMTQGQSLALNDIAALTSVSATTKPKTKWNWRQIVMGVIYTALNVMGAVAGDPELGKELKITGKAAKAAAIGLPFAANVLQTAFNGVQLKGEQSQPGHATLTQYSELAQTLLETFEQLEAEIANIERAVLTDWRKLQLFYRMSCLPVGVDSLFWPSRATPALARKLLPGYILGLLQALLPTNCNYKVSSSSFNTGTPDPGLYLGESGNNTIKYTELNTNYAVQNTNPPQYVQTYNTYTANISSDLFQYLLECGFIPFDFFRSLSGWALPIDETRVSYGAYVYVQNNTSATYTLYLEGAGVNGQDKKDGQYFQTTLNPYQIANLDMEGISDNPGVVTITIEDSNGVTAGSVFLGSDGSIQYPSQGDGYAFVATVDKNVHPYTFMTILSYAA